MALRNLNESYSGGRRSGGTPFAGIAASLIPSTGTSGPSFLYPLIALLSIGPAVQMRGFLAAPDPAVTISAAENGEFDATATADGTYDQFFTLFLDGVQYGATDDFYFTLTFADGVLINPAPGTLTLTGPAPTITRSSDVAIAPGAAEIVLAGFAPTLVQTAGHWLVPAARTFDVAGPPPTIVQSSSGGVADPAAVWAYVLPNGMTAAATLLQLQAQLLDLYRIHGLSAGEPLAVTSTTREAGPVQQSIEDAAGTVTVTRL